MTSNKIPNISPTSQINLVSLYASMRKGVYDMVPVKNFQHRVLTTTPTVPAVNTYVNVPGWNLAQDSFTDTDTSEYFTYDLLNGAQGFRANVDGVYSARVSMLANISGNNANMQYLVGLTKNGVLTPAGLVAAKTISPASTQVSTQYIGLSRRFLLRKDDHISVTHWRSSTLSSLAFPNPAQDAFSLGYSFEFVYEGVRS